MFSYVSLEARIPKGHPLRPMRAMVDRALESLSGDFSRICSVTGRPPIPPEQLLRALLIQILYSVRSERQLVEQLEYNLLFRWFVGLGLDDPIWDPTTFDKNRDRLIAGEIARAFFDAVLMQARERKLLSSEHFTVDGTLIEACASHKSFQRKNGPKDRKDVAGGGSRNATVSFHGEKRLNETHASTTDPESRLFRKKGKDSKLTYMGHALTENRHGLVVDARLTQAEAPGSGEDRLDVHVHRGGLQPGPSEKLGVRTLNRAGRGKDGQRRHPGGPVELCGVRCKGRTRSTARDAPASLDACGRATNPAQLDRTTGQGVRKRFSAACQSARTSTGIPFATCVPDGTSRASSSVR